MLRIWEGATVAGSLNRLEIIGNLTRDPEIRFVNGSGSGKLKFTVAVNRKSRRGTETIYVDTVVWDQDGSPRAQNLNSFLKKGMSVFAEGRLSIRDYETPDGDKRRAVELVASNVQVLDKKARDQATPASAADDAGGDEEFLDEPVDDEFVNA